MMDLLTYQQWDFVADAYIPILAAASLYQVRESIKQKSSVWNGSGIRPMLWSVVIVYLVMKIDAATGIWSSLELDYSTHLALSLALAFPLVRGFWPWRFLVLLSILLYASLMVYQNYHTTEDLLTTTLVVLPVLWFLTANANSRNKLNRSGQIPRTTEHSPTG